MKKCLIFILSHIKNVWWKVFVSVAILIFVVISSYYYLFFLPSKEQDRINIQAQQLQLDKQRFELDKQKTELQNQKDSAGLLIQERRVTNEAVFRQNNQLLLEECINTAAKTYLDYGNIVKSKSQGCYQLTGGSRTGCLEASADAFEDNEKWLQQEKENCFKTYPQNR